MTGQAAMTIDEAIREFGAIDHDLPRAAMQWTLDHWVEAAPRLVEVLSQYADGRDRSEATANVVFIALHLFGEKAETAAFVPLCRLLHDYEATQTAISDGITTTLRQILARTFDGDLAPLHAVVEDAGTDDFIREAALMAMGYLTLTGRIARDGMQEYLRHLLHAMQPQGESCVWVGWTQCVAMLGFIDLAAGVKSLFERAWVDPAVMHYRHFESDLKQGLEDPTGEAAIEENQLQPFVSAIDELSHWYAFSEERVSAAKVRAEREAAQASQRGFSGGDRNPLRHVGRNDPCPCGSGKKFKKCCLGKADFLMPAQAA